MTHRAIRPVVLCALVALTGCNTDGIPEGVYASGYGVQPVSAQRVSGGYLLRPSDRIRIKVFNEPDITGEYEVDANGFVSVPLAGRVRAAGVTVGQVERSIASRLNDGIIKNPKVNVEVATYSPFYIRGEVKRAGEFPYRPGLTVADAIASAGGLTYRADEDKVYVRRAGAAVEEVYPMNAPVPVYPGDNVRVPERFF